MRRENADWLRLASIKHDEIVLGQIPHGAVAVANDNADLNEVSRDANLWSLGWVLGQSGNSQKGKYKRS